MVFFSVLPTFFFIIFCKFRKDSFSSYIFFKKFVEADKDSLPAAAALALTIVDAGSGRCGRSSYSVCWAKPTYSTARSIYMNRPHATRGALQA
jgi:hypothetical protein